jgi:hypothetical protein
MHELYKLEQIALESYGTYNFSRGIILLYIPFLINAYTLSSHDSPEQFRQCYTFFLLF